MTPPLGMALIGQEDTAQLNAWDHSADRQAQG
jgi:hypothetical protein